MIEPKVVTDDRPLRWRLWWRFGFGPILRVIGWLPIAEWRRETWGWHIDNWAIDHIGRRRLPSDERVPERQQVVAQIKAGLPGFCVCDIAYTERQMEDPNCPTHDIERWLSEGFDVRHYPNDNCGNPAHDRILEAWYARADALLERAGIEVRADERVPEPTVESALRGADELGRVIREADDVWTRLEQEPGFSEELRQAEKDIAEGRGTPFRDIERVPESEER